MITKASKFLQKHTAQTLCDFKMVADPRHTSYRKIAIQDMLNPLFMGMLTGRRAIRDVEQLSHTHASRGSRFVTRAVSDTAMWNLVTQMEPEALRATMVNQIRFMHRRKALKSIYGGKKHVTCIDGKTIGICDHDAGGLGQECKPKNSDPYYRVQVVRAVLTSAESCPVIAQKPIPAHGNDMSACKAIVDQVIKDYGGTDLVGVFSFDAGFCSEKNAEYIAKDNDCSYIFALKDNQPTLYEEAKRLLRFEQLGEPDAETEWELRNGEQIKRKLWRSFDIQGYHGWDHATQVWLVRATKRRPEGTGNKKKWVVVQESDRYYITSLPRKYFRPRQILDVVRGHWYIEDKVFNRLDLVWREDDKPWATKGAALLLLGALRCLAYNLVQYLRKLHLKNRRNPKGSVVLPFSTLLEMIYLASLHLNSTN